jgi:hypothetical protein
MKFFKPTLFLISFVMSSLVAYAASSYSISGNVVRVIDFASADSTNINLSTIVKGSAANNPYAARVVPIKVSKFQSWFKPQLGSLIKANAWWFAFAALVESAGWSIDELKNEVVKPSSFLNTSSYGDVVGTTPDGRYSLNAYNAYILTIPGFKWGDSGWRLCTLSYSPTSFCTGHEGLGLVRRFVSQSGVWYWTYIYYSVSVVESYDTTPISDSDVYNAIVAQMVSDPDYAATAFTDPATGKPYADLFDPVSYIPGVTAADEALINCYVNGSLTLTDSSSACYVASQSEYDRIEKLAQDLAAGNTPESTVEELNSDLEQPITQAQYEETNKKYSDAVDAITNALPNNEADTESIDDSFNKLDGIITDIPNTTLPSPAHIQLPHYTECMTLNLTDGKGRELVFPSSSQCEKINQMKSLIGYFLAGLVAMGLIWQLLTRPHG